MMDAEQQGETPREDASELLRNAAYAVVGLGDALAEAVRSLPPADEAVGTLRSWAAKRAESAGRGFDQLVRRGRRTLGSAPLDRPSQWRADRNGQQRD